MISAPKDTEFITLDKIGKVDGAYTPTYEFHGKYINNNHKYYSACPMGGCGIARCIDVGIEGYLLRGDALKIYELAFFSKANILQLGTYKGLSAAVIVQAIIDSKGKSKLDTVDTDPETTNFAKKTLKKAYGVDRINFFVQDGTNFMDLLIVQRKKYDFIFIDHWHGYEATYTAALRVKKLLNPGGFCLFHDYNQEGNADPNHVYGVYQAAHDALLTDPQFDFYGIFGVSGLFRKRD